MYSSDYLKSFSSATTPWGDLARDFINSKSRARTFRSVCKSMEKYLPCEYAWRALKEIHGKYLEEGFNCKNISNNKEN